MDTQVQDPVVTDQAATQVEDSQEPDAIDTESHEYGENQEFHVSAKVYWEAKKAVGAQHAVANRWLVAEPGISKAFGAQKQDDGTIISADCYERGTDAHKALVVFLMEVHPKTLKLSGAIDAVKRAKAGGAEAEEIDELENTRDNIKRKIQLDIGNSMRALKDAFMKNKGGEKGERTLKSVQDVIRELSVRLGKFNDKNTVPADLALANDLKSIADAILKHGKELAHTLYLACPVEVASVAAPITTPWKEPGKVTVTHPTVDALLDVLE